VAARGIEIVQGYGLTEAAPNVLCLPPEDAMRKAGYAGKPYPYVEVTLSRRGELLVRGPERLPRLLAQPEATAAVLRDGWLHTGDMAERDDEGFYRIRGRLKDMFISGGENVYRPRSRRLLHEHPAVATRRSSASRRALGRGRRPRSSSREDGRETRRSRTAGERLARFKVPKRVASSTRCRSPR
jgi:fatty-acyl-CoA synthase